MSTDDLVAFIEARLAEDEWWARNAGGRHDHTPPPSGEHWQWVETQGDEVIQVDPTAGECLDYPDAGPCWALALRSVEHYPTGSGYSLPSFIISTAEEVNAVAAGHIARHDPARALRELPLKRRLLAEHRPLSIVDPNGDEREDWPERVCRICDPRWMGTPDWEQDEDFVPPEPEYCEYLRMLGSIWSDHPGFRSEWLIEENSTDE